MTGERGNGRLRLVSFCMHPPSSQPHPTGHSPEPGASILAVCPLCHANYHPLASHVLAARDEAHLLFIECRRCGSAALALVVASPSGLSTVGAMTDQTPAEVVATSDQEPVSDDDVITVAETLAQDEHIVQLLHQR